MERYLGIVSMLSGKAAEVVNRLREQYDPKTARAVGAHVTLAGPVTTKQPLTEVASVLAAVVEESLPFDVTVSGLRSFQPKSQTSYLGIAPVEKLAGVHDALIARLGWQERFEYLPHVTITEYLSAEETSAAASEMGDLDFRLVHHVRALTLVEKDEDGVWQTVLECMPSSSGDGTKGEGDT